MTTPSMNVPVDLTNPGQFFACCGLLELASRIDKQCQGFFRESEFVLETNAQDVLDVFFRCGIDVETSFQSSEANLENGDGDGDVEIEDPHRGRIYPMKLGEPFNLLLDWWTQKEALEQKLKLWTAGQRVTDILRGHHKTRKKKRKGMPDEILQQYTPSTREHFADAVNMDPTDWLRKAIPIDAPAAFSFDSRLSRNNALDLGHVTNKILAFSPAIDVLCLVAFQRFRPKTIETWNRNLYCTWSQPLPVLVAPLAVLGMLPDVFDQAFEFPVKRRDSQGRFKLFGHAQPARRPND
jgi:CRISPR-associated protein Csb3